MSVIGWLILGCLYLGLALGMATWLGMIDADAGKPKEYLWNFSLGMFWPVTLTAILFAGMLKGMTRP